MTLLYISRRFGLWVGALLAITLMGLRESTAFGAYIVFEPRSTEAFELLRSKIERADAVTTD